MWAEDKARYGAEKTAPVSAPLFLSQKSMPKDNPFSTFFTQRERRGPSSLQGPAWKKAFIAGAVHGAQRGIQSTRF